MQIDSESLLSDADMLSVLQRLPDVKLNLSRNYSPDGNKVQILCRYHADRNFGSANLLVHNGFKGMHCFACGASKSLIQMVQDYGNMNFYEACEFIAEDLGGIENYYIPGTENEYDLKRKRYQSLYSQSKSYNNNVYDYDFPALLSVQELKLIGMNPYGNIENNYIPLNEYDYKPANWQLDNGQYIKCTEETNPFYVDDLGPLYLSFKDYVNDVKNIHGQDQKPFRYKYLVCEHINGNPLISLYKNDKWTYWHLIVSKIIWAIQDTEDKIQDMSLKKGYVSKVYHLKKILKLQNDLLKRYTLSKKTQDIMRKEHYENFNDDLEYFDYPA